MDTSGEVADLMVKESIQITEASIKLLAAGSKNLAAFLWEEGDRLNQHGPAVPGRKADHAVPNQGE